MVEDIKTEPLLNNKEKYLLLWEKNNRRSEHLSNVIKTVDGAAVAAFITIFSFSRLTLEVLFACFIILIFWRVYAHSIDRGIINLYERMIICEERLGIEDDKLALKKNLNGNDWSNRIHAILDAFAIFLILCIFLMYIRGSIIFLIYHLEKNSVLLSALILIVIFASCYLVYVNYRDVKEIEKIVKNAESGKYKI